MRSLGRLLALAVVAVSAIVHPLAAPSAFAGDRLKLETLRDQLAAEPDPEARVRLVRQIAEFGVEAAVRLLARTARDDKSMTVRTAAATAIGGVDNDRAGEALVDLALLGGVRRFRASVGAGLARRPGGVACVAKRLEKPGLDALDVERLVDVLGDVPTEFSVAQLDFLARSKDAARRVAALRALRRNAKTGGLLGGLLAEELGRFSDPDTTRTTLDVAVDAAGPEFRAVLRKLPVPPDAAAQQAIASVEARLDWLDALARRRELQRQGEKYAPGGKDAEEPVPPPPPLRVDLVLLFDATGSMWGTFGEIRKRMAEDVERWRSVGADLRVAVVAFRDRLREAASVPTQYLPFTYDMARVEEFLGNVRSSGVDAQGTDVGLALEIGLDRMAWRENARRVATLIVDTKVGDPEHACDLATRHFREDGTRLSVWWVAHTRTKIPENLTDLAKAGGGDQSAVTTPGGLEPRTTR